MTDFETLLETDLDASNDEVSTRTLDSELAANILLLLPVLGEMPTKFLFIKFWWGVDVDVLCLLSDAIKIESENLNDGVRFVNSWPIPKLVMKLVDGMLLNGAVIFGLIEAVSGNFKTLM